MAPPTVVFGKEELEPLLRNVMATCIFKSLTQSECNFDGHQYVCVPFKRVFKECKVDGKSIRIEVTDRNTNKAKADEMVDSFWNSRKSFTRN